MLGVVRRHWHGFVLLFPVVSAAGAAVFTAGSSGEAVPFRGMALLVAAAVFALVGAAGYRLAATAAERARIVRDGIGAWGGVGVAWALYSFGRYVTVPEVGVLGPAAETVLAATAGGTVGLAVAISRRHNAEDGAPRTERAAELEGERCFESVLDQPFTLVGLVDADGRLTRANGPALRVADADPDDVEGEPFHETPWWQDASHGPEEIRERIERALDGETVRFEADFEATEATYTFDVVFQPVRDDAGDVVGMVAMGRDVSERRERERRLNGLLQTTRDLMNAETEAAVTSTVATATEDILGFEFNAVYLYEDGVLRASATTERTRDLIGEVPDVDGDAPAIRVVERGEPEIIDDISDLDTDHDYGPIRSAVCLPVGSRGVLAIGSTTVGAFDEDDLPVAELLTTNAAAALKQVERKQELREYEVAFENVRDTMYILDAEGRFRMVSGELADWLGADEDDLIGTHVSRILSEEGLRRGREIIAESLRSGADGGSYRADLYPIEGEPFPAEIELSPLPTDEGFRGTVGVVRDRSELVEARDRAADERDRFRALFENVPAPAIEYEPVGDGFRVCRTNDAFEELFGIEAPIRMAELDGIVVPSDRRERTADLMASVAAGEAIDAEVVRETTEGRRWFTLRTVPRECGGGFGIYTDITDRRTREQQLQVLGRVLRHNVRNDMTAIKGFTDALADGVDDESLLAYTDRIRGVANDLTETSETLRFVSKRLEADPPKPEPTDVATIVRETVARARDDYPAAEVRLDCPETAWGMAHPTLELVVDALVENAVEHNEGTAHVDVTVERDEEGVLDVRIADDGPGIPEQELVALDDDSHPSAMKHASGIGLWMVHWFVEQFGGTIHARTDGDGTVVTIRLETLDGSTAVDRPI